MHFAITGAKGTGKSSILDAVSAKLAEDKLFRKIDIVNSPGDSAKRKKLGLGQSGSDQTHLFFAAMHLKSIQPRIQHPRLLDRCLVDHLAYTRMLSKDANLVEMMEEITRVGSSAYSVVFITKIHELLPAIKHTSESDDFRYSIQNEILEIVKEYDIPFVVLSKYIERSVEKVIDVLQQAPVIR